jgi:hypothetical protein
MSFWSNLFGSRDKEQTPPSRDNKGTSKILFTDENRGMGPTRLNDEGWSNWLDLKEGSFVETESTIKLISKNGNVFKVDKHADLTITKMMNRFLQVDRKNFHVYEGTMPSGGYFTIYKPKDPEKVSEYFIATPSGIANGSTISFKVKSSVN